LIFRLLLAPVLGEPSALAVARQLPVPDLRTLASDDEM